MKYNELFSGTGSYDGGNNNLTPYQKEQNEIFFTRIISTLSEGGTYFYPSLMKAFNKVGDKLVCDKEAYHHIAEIVTTDFLLDNFAIKK